MASKLWRTSDLPHSGVALSSNAAPASPHAHSHKLTPTAMPRVSDHVDTCDSGRLSLTEIDCRAQAGHRHAQRHDPPTLTPSAAAP
eukprot:2010951-Rhodomonas_salina.4